MRNAALCVAMLVATTACSAALVEDLRTTAAFDLKCPRGQLRLTEMGRMQSQAVEGCGKRARYVMQPNGAWVMNTLDGEPPAKTPQ